MTAVSRSASNSAHDAHRSAYLAGLGLALAGSTFFSAKAILAKLLYREGVDVVGLMALRMLLSMPFFVGVAIWTWRREPRLSLADFGRIGFLGMIGYYLSSMLDFIGLQYVTAGLERLIMFLTPSFVLLLGIAFFRRHASARQWWSMAIAYAGIVLVFQHDVHLSGSAVAIGAAFVLTSAFTYGLYLLLSAELIARVGALRLTALAMTVSSVAGIVQFFLLRGVGPLFEQTATVWELSAINATVCTVLPVFLTMLGVARVGAGTASQAGMIGPVSILFLAWWVLGEPITALQLGGTALVLAGIFLLSTVRPAPKVEVPDGAAVATPDPEPDPVRPAAAS